MGYMTAGTDRSLIWESLKLGHLDIKAQIYLVQLETLYHHLRDFKDETN
jgi:hypothetical protein